MGLCCVEGCEPDDKEDVTYFPFPIKPSLRRLWRSALGPARVHADSRVCSRHFRPEQMCHVRGKRRLKTRTVPSVMLRRQDTPQNSPPAETNGSTTPHSTTPPPDPSKDPESPRVSPEGTRVSPDGTRVSPEGTRVSPDGTRVSEETRVPECGFPGFGGDDSAENCTVECVPESILHDDCDSNSETDIHKEDIEDIIANYHIKQTKELADRLKPCDAEKPAENKENVAEKQKNVAEKQKNGKEKQRAENAKEKQIASETIDVDDDDDSCLEIGVEKEPVFIEISVGAASTRSGSNSPRDDCMMVLENVECNIDPASLMLEDADEKDRKEEPISLVTSSDDDDVILEEPHIDTVELSDETDEDDLPLVRLAKPKMDSKKLQLNLWGKLYEYFCYHCHFTTTIKSVFKKHKLEHSTIIQMCDVCNFTSPSRAQFSRHMKKHRGEKRFKCHICEYKAKHNMSLMYHLKSHEGVDISSNGVKEKLAKKMKFAYKCSKCRFQTNTKKEMLAHVKACPSGNLYACNECSYRTKRPSDLRRHVGRKHMDLFDSYIDG